MNHTKRYTYLLATIAALLLGVGCTSVDQSSNKQYLPDKVSYNFHVRPILSDRCFSCHGPDDEARQAELRLDNAVSAQKKLPSGYRAIVPGSIKKSALIDRIHHVDPEVMMPPPDSRLSLSGYEKALLSKWIEQGAQYEKHWSFQPIDTTLLAAEKSVSQQIDELVEMRLRRRQLMLSPKANDTLLLRRIYLDLTGLVPTPQAVEEFFTGVDDPLNWELLVDELMAGSAFAEHMAVAWLDLARYADSQGLHSDGWRSMYPWRDWVLRAIKQNKPIDEFIVEQLAGDLLSEPTQDQLIATGFNRNHKTTAEGGAVDEEYRLEYVHDRVATTSTAFMGLTFECARCHDHKYDPISQQNYYELFAFFNQLDELGLTGDDGNSGPNLLVLSPSLDSTLQSVQTNIDDLESQKENQLRVLYEQGLFIQQLERVAHPDQAGLAIHLPMNTLRAKKIDGQRNTEVIGDVQIVQDSLRDMVLSFSDEYQYLQIKQQGLYEHRDAFSTSLWINPDTISTSQTLMGNSGQKGTFWRGWDFILNNRNQLALRLIHALPQDVLQVVSETVVPTDTWTQVGFSYDGSARAEGVRLYINGEEQKTHHRFDRLKRSIYPISFQKEKRDTPLRMGKSYRAFTGEYGIFSGKMDDFRLYNRRLSAHEFSELFRPGSWEEFINQLAMPMDEESKRAFFDVWSARFDLPIVEKIKDAQDQKMHIYEQAPEVMVMKDLSQPRATHVLHRGQYDQPQEIVSAGVPAQLFSLPDSLLSNRLGLAEWLVHPNNPLTSRVFVNRIWQHFFGEGLVSTPHDFGLQGALPTHPQLLDLLAKYFTTNQWNMRKLIKVIVLSKVYQQTSRCSIELRTRDPDNKWLARGPIKPMTAEMLRDNALAASGLLRHQWGGPSVMPAQPEGLWKEKTSSTFLLRAYQPSEDGQQYRRSLYTFVRRTSPHPSMIVLDAPNRSVCTVKRQKTNTPMQALVLLNDPQFVEAARALASRVITSRTKTHDQVSMAYQLLTGLNPSTALVNELVELYEEEQTRFANDLLSANLYTQIGDYKSTQALPKKDLAAMTLVVNTIMNFDSFYLNR